MEHLAWVESGAPFEEAGVVGFLDGMAPDRDVVSGDDVTRVLSRLEAGDVPVGDLYMMTVPRSRRHAAGEYYTPEWLVARVLERAGFGGNDRLIDPMCGAGAFLVAAISRLRGERPGLPASEIAHRVQGMDINPAAVMMARAEYLRALGPRLDRPLRVPVFPGDAILAPPLDDAGRFEVVAGNPPWVGWESLTPEYRAATRELWRHHGLFPDGGAGMTAMLGRGRKDLSMLATFAAADGLLATGGRLCFVIAQSVFKSVGGAAGFRRFMLGDGTPLKVTAVDDFGARPVFPGAASRAAVITLIKGEPTRYPVEYRVWGSGEAQPRQEWAEPVDAEDTASSWLTGSRRSLAAMRGRIGASDYRARAGAYTGGANGVYWLRAVGSRMLHGAGRFVNMPETGKRETPAVETVLEDELIFPLLRASDITRFEARPTAFILLPQDPVLRRGIDETVLAARCPRALEYLGRFRPQLAARKDRGSRSLIDAGAPFYTIFSVTTDTMAAWKVVWPRIASRVVAAVVGPCDAKPVIPQETCTFIACHGDQAEIEAHYLAGMLNSSPFNELAAGFSQTGGKSFGAPHLLRQIAVPRFDPGRAGHRALADLVRRNGASVAQTDLDAAVSIAWPSEHRADSSV
ncbi:MAG TPA: N-6 DNA methylase [Patescibacteria group bacterium]|nr:N-6 DNA methylase [Patescibacteria group bacterium]